MTTEDLDRENLFALMAVQALLGNVSPELHGVAFELVGNRMTFFFLVARRSDVLDEDIDEVTSDMEGLALPDDLDVNAVITVDDGERWFGKQKRLIFLRREY